MLMNLPKRPRSRKTTMPGTFANNVSSSPRPTFSPVLKVVPRCRTRMDPPVTVSPPKRFTPRRCALESRPFLELPKPFLCAMDLCQNLAHLHLRLVLPVIDGALVLLLAFEFEHDNFFAASVFGDGGLHARPCQRRAGRHFVGIVHHRQHALELHFRADIAR